MNHVILGCTKGITCLFSALLPFLLCIFWMNSDEGLRTAWLLGEQSHCGVLSLHEHIGYGCCGDTLTLITSDLLQRCMMYGQQWGPGSHSRDDIACRDHVQHIKYCISELYQSMSPFVWIMLNSPSFHAAVAYVLIKKHHVFMVHYFSW